MHLKLINAIAKSAHELNLSKEHDMSAHRFHADLFASGFERIILVGLTWLDKSKPIFIIFDSIDIAQNICDVLSDPASRACSIYCVGGCSKI